MKAVIFGVSLAPFAWLLFRALTGRLSVNPIEDITLTTGIWALRFLIVTVAVTPVRRITGWNAVIRYRRMLGLFAFFYASLHFLTYIVLDQFFALQFILGDIAKRPYITVGFVAFVLMIPLALTSTRAWIQRLGKRWQQLHRLVYISAALAVVHYYWKVKADTTFPMRYAILLAVLFGVRIWWRVKGSRGSKGF